MLVTSCPNCIGTMVSNKTEKIKSTLSCLFHYFPHKNRWYVIAFFFSYKHWQSKLFAFTVFGITVEKKKKKGAEYEARVYRIQYMKILIFFKGGGFLSFHTYHWWIR